MTTSSAMPGLRWDDVIAILARRRLWASCVAGLVFLSLIIAAPLMQSPLFRAEAVLTADRGLKPVASETKDPLAGLVPDQLLNTQRELLTSRSVLEQALRCSDLLDRPPYAGTTDPAPILESRLRTLVIRNTWIIQVSFDDEDPIRAERGLQAVLDAYLQQQVTAARNRAAADMAFVTVRCEEARHHLEAARTAEQAFRSANGIAGLDPDRNYITARIQSLAERQALLDDRIAASTALLQQVASADAITDPRERQLAYLRIDRIPGNSIIATLQSELFNIEGTVAELETRYLARHPKLIEAKSQLAIRAEQMQALLAAAKASIEREHRALLEQRTEIETGMTGLRKELNAYREKLVELQQLGQTTLSRQRQFDEAVARQAQIAALASYDDRRMVVNSTTKAASVPRRIDGVILLVLAILAGGFAGLAAAGFAEVIDPLVRDAQQVGRIIGGIPTGRVPLCSPSLVDGANTPPDQDPAAMAAVQTFTTVLRTRCSNRERGHAFAILSATSGDGRSTIALQLATAMAWSGLKTLLVDADLRNPALSARCSLDNQRGLLQVLAGESSVTACCTPVHSLHILPSGTSVSDGPHIHIHTFGHWLDQARLRYDILVLDNAVDQFPGQTAFFHAADSLILVVRIGHTRIRDLRQLWGGAAPEVNKYVGVLIIG